MSKDYIQDGVFFRPQEKPKPYFAVVFLQINNSSTALEVGRTLERLVQTYKNLQKGTISDLPGQIFEPGDLRFLIGYGSNLFSTPDLKVKRPQPLTEVGFRKPSKNGGGDILLGAGLQYHANVTENTADASIAFQFHADTSLAINRALVETWKVIYDEKMISNNEVLRISGSYSGFGRSDKRSWIDFHDGTSNMRSEERIKAIAVKKRAIAHPDRWTESGTYMVFMRIQVHLSIWRSITREEQEVLVGRDKLSGCPIVSFDSNGKAIVPSGCPVSGTLNVEESGNSMFKDTERPSNLLLRKSHIHRANHRRNNIEDPESRRIYRQGYEFMEGFSEHGEPVLGLNFVSFQDHPNRVTFMLKQPGWLGEMNFGGDVNSPYQDLEKMLIVHSAGIFIAPRKDNNEVFPGSSIFGI